MSPIACGDLHIRSNSPRFRKDKNYLDTCLGKLTQIVNLANHHRTYIVCSGDLFDSSRVGYDVINKTIQVLKKFKYTFYTVVGNHDQHYHSLNLEKTPIQTLELAGVIKIIPNSGDGRLYGCSWEEELPTTDQDDSILVIHYPITENEPPFFMNHALSAKDMMEEAKDFKFIISGDFHDAFVRKEGNRILINTGTMMRNSIDQIDNTPKVFLLNTIKSTVKSINLKVQDSKDIFKLVEAEQSKKKEDKFKEEMDSLVKTLKDSSSRPSFESSIKSVIKTVNPSKEIKNTVKRYLRSSYE